MEKLSRETLAGQADEKFMDRALRLAKRGLGRTSPNPPVGAVVVRDGEVVAEAYHHGAGKPHAEAEALEAAGERARGAAIYVTLEPCCHYGRTPPCAPALIHAGIKRVVAPFADPDPRVAGKGFDELRRAGVEVVVGIGQKEAESLIEAHRKYVTERMPFVTLKMAASLDGKIATRAGRSRWISSEKARRWSRRLRRLNDAIMVGLGTVIADDPELLAGKAGGRQPLRVVVDSLARLPLDARLLSNSRQPPLIAVTGKADPQKVEQLRELGAEVVAVPSDDGRVDLRELLRKLAEREVTSVVVEGGGTLAASFLEKGLVDRVAIVIAPIILGGQKAPTPVEGEGVEDVAQALRVLDVEVRRLGPDILVQGRLAQGADRGAG
jgi:diaminohydroxyphosphoribosylaminopyrimidine deaminase/5-amino-6-(5-phosphoribosylamino)uracil reductase